MPPCHRLRRKNLLAVHDVFVRLGGGSRPKQISKWDMRQIRGRAMNTPFLHKLFLGHPCKIPETSRFLPSKLKEDKLSREGTNFSTPTPFAWKTPTPPGGLRTHMIREEQTRFLSKPWLCLSDTRRFRHCVVFGV